MHRYPKGQHDKSLQAWDSADQYIVEHVLNDPEITADSHVTVTNDAFGAIAVGLSHLKLTCISDSHVSLLATKQNIELNELTMPRWCNSLASWSNTDVVILKLTKNSGYLDFQLNQISQLRSPCKIIACGKTTQVTSNVLKVFDKYFDNVTTSLAKKKSRLIFAEHNKVVKPKQSKYPISINWPEQSISLQSHANVFAKEQIDIGGRFLADHLPDIEAGQYVVDLGCGNGLLGLACLNQLKSSDTSAHILFTDESFMAVESAKLNVQNNFADMVTMCEFRQDDGLTSQAPNSVDVVLCNPPFHQQNTITEHIAFQMFKQSFLALKSKGCLYVVANSHLPYQRELKKLFGGFKVIAQNNKFHLFQCNKN